MWCTTSTSTCSCGADREQPRPAADVGGAGRSRSEPPFDAAPGRSCLGHRRPRCSAGTGRAGSEDAPARGAPPVVRVRRCAAPRAGRPRRPAPPPARPSRVRRSAAARAGCCRPPHGPVEPVEEPQPLLREATAAPVGPRRAVSSAGRAPAPACAPTRAASPATVGASNSIRDRQLARRARRGAGRPAGWPAASCRPARRSRRRRRPGRRPSTSAKRPHDDLLDRGRAGARIGAAPRRRGRGQRAPVELAVTVERQRVQRPRARRAPCRRAAGAASVRLQRVRRPPVLAAGHDVADQRVARAGPRATTTTAWRDRRAARPARPRSRPSSIRKPRIFTWSSARPRNSSSPSAVQRTRSPVRYIRAPAGAERVGHEALRGQAGRPR